MERLTKVSVGALVVGIIVGLIVVPLAMFLRDRKFVNKATGRYTLCGSQVVYVSLKNPPAPNGTFPDTFEICTNDTVKWAPFPGELITKFAIVFDGNETPFLNSSGSGPDQGTFEWPKDSSPDPVSTGGAKDPCLSLGCTYVLFGSKYFKYKITVTATVTDASGEHSVVRTFDPGGRISK